ncbi:MAG TPA: O-antigen ligase family protein, partial [Gemmatales bacterium]|nr:O-antigen ligase family protein [Gemmatales bacterium]
MLYGLVFTVSNAINLGLYTARIQGIEFFKQFLYYLLLISVIDSTDRLRIFFKSLVIFILLVTALVLMDHHEILHFEAIEPIIQNEYDVDGAILDSYPRLRYLGFFEDPNDLSMILGVSMFLAFYLYRSGQNLFRYAWLMPLGFFAYLMALTQSRGGMLGLLAAIVAYYASRLGWKKALPMALAAVAGLLMVVGGRQANFSLSSGTGQARLQHWSDGLILMSTPRSVLFGIGYGMYEDQVGHVAHNSYIHAFVETGMLG